MAYPPRGVLGLDLVLQAVSRGPIRIKLVPDEHYLHDGRARTLDEQFDGMVVRGMQRKRPTVVE